MINKYILIFLFILGNILHIGFMLMNDILYNADSFAYLQMTHNMKNLSIDGFGTGWFGFFYSIPILFVNIFISNDFIAGQIANLILFNIFIFICYVFGKSFLKQKYNVLFLLLLFLSPVLLRINSNILSENIFIIFFMLLVIVLMKYKNNVSSNIMLALILAILYYIRSESFIYILSIFLVIAYLFFSRKINFKKAFINVFSILFFFFLFISPYILYLHSITGEWGITNKGSANFRQAELRGTEKMDDDGFEKAVGELTDDKKNLKAGFAGGLKYSPSEEKFSIIHQLLKAPEKHIYRFIGNQKKLYLNNIPNIVFGDSYKLYKTEGGSKLFFKNPVLFIIFILITFVFFIGIIKLFFEKQYYFLFGFFSLFFIGSVFFTLFFVLDRYFVVFIPLFLFIIIYGLQKININNSKILKNIFFSIFSLFFIGIYSLGVYGYYNNELTTSVNDYAVKKDAGEWLENNFSKKYGKNIMERFPVVTYYAKSWERYLIPYTTDINDVLVYAKYNNIDYIVVDSLDFLKYRPELKSLLDENKNHPGFLKQKVFFKNNQKVILYRIIKE